MELSKTGFLLTGFSALLRPLIGLLDKGSLPIYRGEVTLAGLERPVRVRWDRFAIPHVFAFNERDLFLAQGYLHAQERLWQMEMSRRLFSGRMAEIFGDFALPWRDLWTQLRGRSCADFDYFLRLLGIHVAAVASLDVLPEQDQFRLRAYCDGVNRYIEQCAGKLPWEFRLLRHEPEPWRPEDTLTIGKGLAFTLSTALFTRLNFIVVAAKLKDDPEKLRQLFPSYPDDAPTITRAVFNQTRGLWEFSNGVLAAGDWHPAGNGSNNWAVAPSRSTSGGAILCNDPHLRMTLPSIWYLMHLKAEIGPAEQNGYEVWGASIPGIPYIQLGHNRCIAWGMTAAVCDDVEIYRERLHASDPERYMVGHRWQTLDRQRELIAIRRGRSLEKIVRWSRHGPVISDFSDPVNRREILSLRWTAHDPSQELTSLYDLNRARNWQEFQNGLCRHTSPSLNFVYADRDGNIGYTLAGKIPRRRRVPSLLPVAGWNEENDWGDYIPFNELPSIYNPPDGIVATANNRMVDSAYPYYLSHFFEPPHRFRRIHQLLAESKRFSADDLAAIQLDNLSLHAAGLIDALKSELAQLTDEKLFVKAAANRLLSWDGRCSEASIDAAIFHVFHHRLLANLLSPTLGEDLFTAYVEILNQCIVPTDRILNDPNSVWFSGRSRYELVATSLREACAELQDALGEKLEEWQWGRIHKLHLNHALGRISVFKCLLGVGPLATPGDGMTINVGFYRHSNPYSHTVGAAVRFVVDFGAQQDSGFILPSGQSGHPLSVHYADQTAMWLGGKRVTLSDDSEGNRPYNGGLLLKPD
jgi:penicillin amidase